jgi:K(+)-stimulated pyrophosphate-energized sodium pump
LLAVELGVYLGRSQGPMLGHVLALVLFLVAVTFVWRSFYGMRIGSGGTV